MKRFHVNLNVADLDKSIQFYSEFFKQKPDVVKNDYAKWMLDDPRINLAINTRGGNIGVDHLGIQTENAEDFSAIEKQLSAAEAEVFNQGKTTCCYAQSNKAWVLDPDGNSWESFLTTGESTTYNGEELSDNSKSLLAACCVPKSPQANTNCC